jgi:ATP-dependent RNA helicase RhlE
MRSRTGWDLCLQRPACSERLDPVPQGAPVDPETQLERDSALIEVRVRFCALPHRNARTKGFFFVTPAVSSPASSTATTFAQLALASPILDALIADGYQNPTPIQAQAIPHALAGRDVLGIAQTGTGKTAAFALPILNRLIASSVGGNKPGARLPVGRKPRVLVLSPTRELAAQISESFASYGRHTPIRFAVIFGGVGQGPQVRAIQQGIDVLVATPGRLIDLLQQRLVNLSEVEFFVLDEADRMLDMGFIEPIRRISALLPKSRQTMLFSATMPKEIRHLADSLLNQPVTVTVTPVSSAVDRIDQKLYFVLKAQKTQLLVHLFGTLQMDRAVVFTKTKHGADRLTRKLKAAGIQADAIHGDKAQNQRTRALDAFKSGRTPVLVATDVAARGLDVDDITHVVNFDLPMEPEAYVHRIGRTARAGKSGHAISFCDVEEKGLLKQVEKLIKFEIPRERVPVDVPKSDEVAAKSAPTPSQRAPISEATRAHAGPQRSSERARGPRIDRPLESSSATREDRPHREPQVTPARTQQGPRPQQSARPQGESRANGNTPPMATPGGASYAAASRPGFNSNPRGAGFKQASPSSRGTKKPGGFGGR